MEIPRLKLKPRTRIVFLEWFFIIFSVTALMYLYYFITWWGLRDYLKPNLFNDYLNTGFALVKILIQGVLFGILFGLIDLLVDNTKIRRKSFGAIVFLKSILYFVAVMISQTAVYAIFHIFNLVPVEMMHNKYNTLSK